MSSTASNAPIQKVCCSTPNNRKWGVLYLDTIDYGCNNEICVVSDAVLGWLTQHLCSRSLWPTVPVVHCPRAISLIKESTRWFWMRSKANGRACSARRLSDVGAKVFDDIGGILVNRGAFLVDSPSFHPFSAFFCFSGASLTTTNSCSISILCECETSLTTCCHFPSELAAVEYPNLDGPFLSLLL